MTITDRCLALPFLLLAASAAQAVATIEIVNGDPANVGFNDMTPANIAAGANGATTLGEQRLRVVEYAAGMWGSQLTSAVPIKVSVRMVTQPCGPDGTTLASAGPADMAVNFANAPRANTAYHIALANALAGTDLVPERNDINANFNIAIDAGCNANAVGWWYGLDPEVPVPADRIALLPVALHELAHGLGFSAVINLETGEYPSSSPTIWSNYLYDLETMKHWRNMTSMERAISARNERDLVWSGNAVNRYVSYLPGAPALMLETPRSGFDEITELAMADFGAVYPASPISGHVVRIYDGIAASGDPIGTVSDGCEYPFDNGQRLAGRIALIERGFCAFVDKVRNAQRHGAVAVIIVNNQDGTPPGMAGADPTITIPAVGVTREDGARMKRALLRPRLMVSFGHTEERAGVSRGCIRMHAPTEVEPGSSVSHFTSAAYPDLLMEPSVSRGSFDYVDPLASGLLGDIGWPLGFAIDPPPPNNCIAAPLP